MGSLQNRQHNFVAEQNIYHFGDIKVYEDTQGSQFFTQQYTFIVDQNAETEFINHLRRKNNQCPFLIQIKHISLTRDNYCSNSAKISVVFQYLPYTLQNLLQRKQHFTESQIIKIFYCLIYAIKYLNENESYHGDISPQFIYYDNKSKYIEQQLGDYIFKIFDSSYFKPFLNGYYRAQKEKSYSAPEVLANLGQKRVYPLYNHHTADTFSVGLVVLQCLSLVDPLGAYSKSYQIDFYYIQSMLRLAERRGYSPDLVKLVRECVQQRNRPEIGIIIQKFENLKLKQRMQSSSSNKLSLKKRGSWQNTYISTKQFEPRLH